MVIGLRQTSQNQARSISPQSMRDRTSLEASLAPHELAIVTVTSTARFLSGRLEPRQTDSLRVQPAGPNQLGRFDVFVLTRSI
jgi:hypothetical protein